MVIFGQALDSTVAARRNRLEYSSRLVAGFGMHSTLKTLPALFKWRNLSRKLNKIELALVTCRFRLTVSALHYA